MLKKNQNEILYTNIINKYFNKNIDEYNLYDLLSLVHNIQQHGFIINIQNLDDNIDKYEWRIWFNRSGDLLECSFGQIGTSSILYFLDKSRLEDCLLYSISQWCLYKKYYDSDEYIFSWTKTLNENKRKVNNLFIEIDNKKYLVTKIHDEDSFVVETTNTRWESDECLSTLKDICEKIILNNIVGIINNPEKFTIK